MVVVPDHFRLIQICCQTKRKAPVGGDMPRIRSTWVQGYVSIWGMDVMGARQLTSAGVCFRCARMDHRNEDPNRPTREPIDKLTRDEKRMVSVLNQRLSQVVKVSPFCSKPKRTTPMRMLNRAEQANRQPMDHHGRLR